MAGGFRAGRFATARTLLAVALLAFAAGCTMVRLGYSQLDTWSLWRADEAFDLEPAQRQAFQARFERLHAWHRVDQLPDYAAFLDEVVRRLHRGFTEEDARWVRSGVEARYRTLAARGAEDAAALLFTVTPQQLEHVQAYWKGRNERFARRYRLNAGPEARERARVAREIERIEEWTGDLDPAQEARIARLLRAVPPGPPLWHQERLRRQREFLALMAQRDDPARFGERVREFLVHWEKGRDPALQRALDEWQEKKAAFYAEVAELLRPAQQETLMRRLRRYSEDFAWLAGRGKAAAARR